MDAKNGTVRKDIVALRELDVVALVKGFYYFILGSFFLCLVGLITWLSPWVPGRRDGVHTDGVFGCKVHAPK